MDDAHSQARAEAIRKASALESQFQQAVSAAEILGAVARESGGSIRNFQKLATELLATRPGLASLEYQPGGVVREIVPAAGHERAMGVNILLDPAQRGSANAALQRRMLTVSGPVLLYSGATGVVARVPILQHGTDGREVCVGFVAASMRVSEALTRARLGEVAYDYLLFIPESRERKSSILAVRGGPSFGEAETQRLRVFNLELVLALQPSGGWLETTKLCLEIAGVLILSGLLCLVVNLLENRRELESALADLNRRVTRETAERKQAEEALQTAKDEAGVGHDDLTQTRAALQKSESQVTELQTSMRAAQQASEATEARLKQALGNISELQGRLEVTTRAVEEAVQVRQTERAQAQAALQKAEQALRELQARFDAAVRAEKEAAAAAQKQRQQDQAKIAELEKRLEGAAHSAAEAADAQTAKLKKAEANNQELAARLRAAEQKAEARIAELTKLLQQATEELDRQHETAQARAEITESEPPVTSESQLGTSDELEKSDSESTEAVTAPVEVSAETDLLPQSEVTHQSSEAALEPAPARESAPATEVDAPPAEEAKDSEPVGKLEADAPKPQPTEIEAVSESSPPKRKSTKAKQKNSRRDPQMDFFQDANDAAGSPRVKQREEEEPVLETPALLSLENSEPISEATEEPENTEAESGKENDSEPAKQHKPARRLPPPPPVDPAELRKAVNEISPLFIEQDPGAKDCFKANRNTFRSAFHPEAFVEFEQLVKKAEYAEALDHLRKAVKKHGI